jgi:hypothetical protein
LRLSRLRYARKPRPARIATPPRPNRVPSCSPAVPPPPVCGAPFGIGVADEDAEDVGSAVCAGLAGWAGLTEWVAEGEAEAEGDGEAPRDTAGAEEGEGEE